MKYPTVFHLVSEVCGEHDVPLVLIGGFAVNYYNVTRQTVDLDFLITEEGFRKIELFLKDEGYKERHSQEVFSRLTTDTDYLLALDFMFVDDETLSQIIVRGTETEIAGRKFIVPSLNHLIALKLHAIKYNPGPRKRKDLWDILEMIRMNKIDIGSDDFRDIALKYGTPELYREIRKRI